MKIILINILLLFSITLSANTLSVSGNVADLNNSPIANHWVIIEASDTTNLFFSTDSVLTNFAGNYSYTLSNPNLSQIGTAKISVKDCQGMQHVLLAFMPGGANFNFQICAPISSCNAMFTFVEDTFVHGKFYFTNTSTNNAINIWTVNGNVVGQQTNLVYTFNNNPSVNTVCLIVSDINLQCSDTFCANVIVNYCNTTFSYTQNMFDASFTASGATTVDSYNWNFGDGNTFSTTNNTVNHTYANQGGYLVTLESIKVFNQDTCVEIVTDSLIISVAYPSGNIIGYVFADSDYLEYGNVHLYTKDTINGRLDYYKSSTILYDSIAASSYYLFDNIPYGKYYIKSQILPASSLYGFYFDTWASQSADDQIVSWQDAQSQMLNTSLLVVNINLKAPEVFFSGGQGVISGEITNTMGFNAGNQVLYLMNHDKKFITSVQPGPNGQFSFDSLIIGTYYIRPELINVYPFDYEVILSSNSMVVDNVQISVDSNHYFTSIVKANFVADVNLYPNPVADYLNLHISVTTNTRINICIYDIIGNKIYEKEELINGESYSIIDFKNKKIGMYILTISDGKGIITKKIIKH